MRRGSRARSPGRAGWDRAGRGDVAYNRRMSATASAPSRDLTRVVLSVLGIGLLITGTFWVLSPFLGALLWATMIVVATWPLMVGLQARLGGKRGAAVAVMTIALLLALFVPLYWAVATLVEQADRIADLVRSLPDLRVPPPPTWVEALPLVGARAARRWQALAALPPDEVAARLAPYLKTGLGWFAAKAGSFGSMVLHFLLTVVIAAILFARGEGAADNVRRFFRRLAGERGDAIVVLSGKAIRAVALGIVVTAGVQTTIAGVGFVAVGAPFAGFLTAVVLVLCIAQIGPLLVMAPVVIWLYSTGSPGRGTVLLVFTLVAGAIDNVLRPVLIKRGADLSLLLIFPGVIGGLLWLGIIGLFVGPVVLAVTANLVESWVTSGLGEPAAAPVRVEPAADQRQAFPNTT
jgi:predicted PurR-regulated permease PerM